MCIRDRPSDVPTRLEALPHPGGRGLTEREFVPDGRVESILDVGGVLVLTETGDQVQAIQSGIPCHVLPTLDERAGVGQFRRLVDEEERPTVDADVPAVLERRSQVLEVARLVLGPGIRLLDEDAIGSPVPYAGPRLVGPVSYTH